MHIAENYGTTNYFVDQLAGRGVELPPGFSVVVSFEDELFLFYRGEGVEKLRNAGDRRFDNDTHHCGTIDVDDNDLDTIADWVGGRIRDVSKILEQPMARLAVA